MRGGLAYALAQLSDRERVLLFLLAIVIVPVAVIFLAVMPLMETRDRANDQLRESKALLVWVSDQVRLMPAEVAGNAAETGASAVIGLSGIEESLVTAGLREQVSKLSDRTDGGVDLSLEAAPFEQLSAWLTQMSPTWGYALSAFRIEAATPGLVNANFELRPAE